MVSIKSWKKQISVDEEKSNQVWRKFLFKFNYIISLHFRCNMARFVIEIVFAPYSRFIGIIFFLRGRSWRILEREIPIVRLEIKGGRRGFRLRAAGFDPLFFARRKKPGPGSGWKERFGRRVTLTRSFADAQENPCRPTDMKYEIWYFPSIFLLPSLARISVRG